MEELKKENKSEKIEDKVETPKSEPIKSDDYKLVIGLNDKNKELFIPEKSRYLNSLVIGTKGSGKTTSVLPMFVEQDLKRKNAGMTIISTSKEMSYNLYSLAKKYKRKIHFLKPSINNEITNKFLWMQDYNYDYINENIINYKEAIKKKDVVIIDMELLKYKSDALKTTAMLLLQLRLDIQETDITQRCPHFLYVDDAYNYLKFLEDLLIYSDNYNLGVTLFLQSRNQLVTPNRDYTSMINNNIRTTMLLNNITIEDYNYYKDKFFEKTSPSDFFNREFNTMLYETIDAVGVRRTGITRFKKLLIGDWSELENKSKKIRTSLLKEKRKLRELELKDKYKKSLNIKTDNSQNKPKTEDIKTPKLTHEPKPINSDVLKSLTEEPLHINKPRNINFKNDNKKQPVFTPPKTNYDIVLEKNTKPSILDLVNNMDDELGTIKKDNQPKEEDKQPKQDNNKPKKEEKTQPKVDDVKENKTEKKVDNLPIEKPKQETNSSNEEGKVENTLEQQKQKELDEIKLQEEIDKHIQEQILNEEKERKRLVATRIFNNYNENIDYCDEVFDFKYE